MAMPPEDAMERLNILLAHAWMVRNFLKHAEEVQDDEDMLEVHRMIFDSIRAVEPSYQRQDAKEYLRRARGKLAKLRQAADLFAREYRRVSDHTNFEMAARSFSGCVRQMEEILEDRGSKIKDRESRTENREISGSTNAEPSPSDPRSSLPALLGGLPLRPQGPPAWPLPDDDVLEALQRSYHDGSWGQYHGGQVERLEKELARYHEVGFAATCASGTVAMELALRALKIGPGDEVILAAYDYGGNFLTVHALGARPVLVDVHPENWNLDPQRLGEALGPATRAVIVSHLHGGVVPMREVMALCRARGVSVIEDAAQAPGARVQGRKAGTWGDAGILSFGGSKLLSAGRGGAVLTPHQEVYHRIRLWVHRGNHICPLSELQAAVLLPQLAKLEERNARRAANVRLLGRLLQDVPGIQPFRNPGADTLASYYKLGWQLDSSAFGLSRELFVAALQAEGFAVDEGFRALHVGRSPGRFRQAGTLVEAERAHQGAVIVHHPVLLGTEADMELLAAAVRKVHDHRERLWNEPPEPAVPFT